MSFNASPEIRSTGQDSVGFDDKALGRLAVPTVSKGDAIYAGAIDCWRKIPISLTTRPGGVLSVIA